MIDPTTLSRALARQVAERGAAEAFVAPGERHTWAALQDGARRIARGLHAAGVRRGDHVGVLLGNGGTWVQVFYACALLGAVTVPVNTRFKTDELAFCLKQADVKVLLTADTFLGIDFLDLLTQVEPALDQALPGAALPLLRQVVVLGERCPRGARAWADFLRAGEAEHPLLEDRVAPVPQREPEAPGLLQVREGGHAVLVPPEGTAPGVVVREELPRVAVGAVVLADGAPGALGDVRAPVAPAGRAVLRPRYAFVFGSVCDLRHVLILVGQCVPHRNQRIPMNVNTTT